MAERQSYSLGNGLKVFYCAAYKTFFSFRCFRKVAEDSGNTLITTISVKHRRIFTFQRTECWALWIKCYSNTQEAQTGYISHPKQLYDMITLLSLSNHRFYTQKHILNVPVKQCLALSTQYTSILFLSSCRGSVMNPSIWRYFLRTLSTSRWWICRESLR